MPGTSRAKHPKGITIDFFEDTHKYISVINGKEVSYISGTSFIHKFFKPFDADGKIARRCAEKEGVSVDEIKAKWAKAGRDASTLGTKIHECCEDVFLNREKFRNTPSNDKEQHMMDNAIKIAKRIYTGCDILGVEKIVFSPSLRIAGTIDLLARSTKTGEYLIIDHKTNKSIDTEDKWNNYALSPISHLHDVNYIHYSLQLNLYKYLLKREGYVPKDAKFRMYLNHITEQKADIIEVFDMESEIKDMMISFLSGETNNLH